MTLTGSSYITPGYMFIFCSGVSKLFGVQGSPSSGSLLSLLSPRFLFIEMLIVIYLFVLYDSLTS